MVDFVFDNSDNWYIAGQDKSTKEYKVWKAPFDEKGLAVEIFTGEATSIDLYSTSGNTYVFAIVDSEIRMYGTPGNRRPPLAGDFVVIRAAENTHDWAALIFDSSAKYLYVSDRKMNQVYRFDVTSSSYPERLVAGNPDGVAADDETHLDHPEGIRFARGDLYILQGSPEEGHIVRWTPGKSKRKFVYDFAVN
ncbi:hypothetical protein Pmar_PMAR008130, partial [Perkinsus marinus ATCC 50983]